LTVAAAPTVTVVDPEDFPALCDRLGAILADAVAHGAGVNFMLPFRAADGAAYWRERTEEVRTGARIVLVAEDAADVVVGTVSLVPAWMPNQPHRAEVSKLLVHSGHRRAGVATALMRAAEEHARAIGRTLLTLDCVAGGPEEAFYVGAGYRVVGTIPGYALSPTGELEGATFLVKDLAAGA
jgi:GNAT superfamily N-acetyltransferase